MSVLCCDEEEKIFLCATCGALFIDRKSSSVFSVRNSVRFTAIDWVTWLHRKARENEWVILNRDRWKMAGRRRKRKHQGITDDDDCWLERLFTQPATHLTSSRTNEQDQNSVIEWSMFFHLNWLSRCTDKRELNRWTLRQSFPCLTMKVVQTSIKVKINLWRAHQKAKRHSCCANVFTTVKKIAVSLIIALHESVRLDDTVALALGLSLLKRKKRMTWSSTQAILNLFNAFNGDFPIRSTYTLSKIIRDAARLPIPLSVRKVYVCSTCVSACEEKKCKNCVEQKKDFQVARFMITDVTAHIALLLSRKKFTNALRNPMMVDLGTIETLLIRFSLNFPNRTRRYLTRQFRQTSTRATGTRTTRSDFDRAIACWR